MDDNNVLTYFELDHQRLDELFRNYCDQKLSDIPEACANFSEFKTGLQRHIRWEEEILFPLFERKVGSVRGGPIAVMRSEHSLILKYLNEISRHLGSFDPRIAELETQLMQLLSAHNEKEEYILYPAIDRLLTMEEEEQVFSAMRNILEKVDDVQ